MTWGRDKYSQEMVPDLGDLRISCDWIRHVQNNCNEMWKVMMLGEGMKNMSHGYSGEKEIISSLGRKKSTLQKIWVIILTI